MASYDFVFNAFTQNQNLNTYSSQQLMTLAQNIDKLTPNNTVSVTSIYDQLLQYQQSGTELNSASLLQFLSMENPSLPSPSPNMDSAQTNSDIQAWVQGNTALIPNGNGTAVSNGATLNSTESFAYMMGAITFTNNMAMQAAASQSAGIWNSSDSESDTQEIPGSSAANINEEFDADLNLILGSGLQSISGSAGVNLGTSGMTLDEAASLIMSNAYALPGQTLPSSSNVALNENTTLSENLEALANPNSSAAGATNTANVTSTTQIQNTEFAKKIMNNTSAMIDDATSAAQNLLNSIPPNSTNPEVQGAAAVIGQILQALAKGLKNFLGRSWKRETSKLLMQMLRCN